jgi:ABC-type sugar transport system permease subunit
MAKWKDSWTSYLLILPAVTYVVYLAFYPAVEAVYGSFKVRNGVFTLYNYQFVNSVFHLTNVVNSGASPIINTFIVTASALLLQFIFAFTIATLLSKPFKGRAAFSAIFLIPFGVATIVTGVVFHAMFARYGGFANSFLVLIGLHPVDWESSYLVSLIVLIVADSWKNTPIVTLILLAGMTSISPDLYSQAMVDGAGTFQRFLRVTLPNLKGFIAIALMIRGISEFNIFAMALLLYPYQLLTTMTYSLYDTVNAHPAYAGATILLAFVLIFATIIMVYRGKYGRIG